MNYLPPILTSEIRAKNPICETKIDDSKIVPSSVTKKHKI